MTKTRKGLLFGILTLMAAVCMLFAACGSDKVELKFNTMGGGEIASVELDVGAEYTLPTPEREGFSFEGWYDNEGFSGSAVTSVTAESDKTFYAKWEQMYRITLDLGGGTMSGETSVYAKAGTNIAQFLSGRVPELKDHQFGEWLDNATGSPLADGAVMPQSDVTLKAHYKVAYTVELHLQNTSLDGYEKAEEDYVGYEYANGTAFTPAPELEGFTQLDDYDGNVTGKVLDDGNAAANKFVLYFDRKVLGLTLNANYPDTSEGGAETRYAEVVYGTEIPSPFTYDGYLLLGWSKSADGAVVYRSDYFGSRLYNGTKSSDPYSEGEGCELYAVWELGYQDIFGVFGGGDTIYHFSEDARDIYLLRGGILFSGEYNGRAQTFTFITADQPITGKLYDNGTFAFYSDSRANFPYIFGQNFVGTDDHIRIFLDGYGGLTYADTTGTLAKESKGTYTIDENGLYHVTYTEGVLAGQEFIYMLNANSSSGAVFLVRGEEADWGPLSRGGVNDEGELVYYREIFELTLDGFSSATYRNPDGTTSVYAYKREDDVITLLDRTFYREIAEAHVMFGASQNIYFFYFSEYDQQYTSETGEILALDGMYGATYADGLNPQIEGTYTLSTALFGDLIHFRATDGTERLFLTYSQVDTQIGEDGETTETVSYHFREVPTTYTEYYYMQDRSIPYSPFLVLDDEEAGKANVYGYASGEYFKILTGSWTLDAETGIYTFTTEDVFTAPTVSGVSFDIASVTEFTFSVDVVIAGNNGTAYPIMYWHSMTLTGDEEATEYDKVYEGESGTLTVTRGFAVYKTADETITGGIVTDADGISTLYDTLTEETYLMRLNDEEDTFELLDQLLGAAVGLFSEDESQYEVLTFDGRTGAVLEIFTEDENGEISSVEHAGTFGRTGDETPFGFYIYRFTETEGDITFTFILVPLTQSTLAFSKYDEKFNGVYTVENENGTLTLDGYGYMASYEEDGETVATGIYQLSVDEKSIRISVGSMYLYFDLAKDGSKTCTLRGLEYGTYYHLDNGMMSGLLFSFDGYGVLTVADLSQDEEVTYTGSYALQDDGTYLLSYAPDIRTAVNLIGYLGRMTIGGSVLPVFVEALKEVDRSYVNVNDWSVLELDDHGNAVRYDREGVAEEGQYQIVTDTLLYYVNNSGDDACIYVYDGAAGTATPVKNTERAYYTANFEAMRFTSYGFMIMDGTTRYYYSVGTDGNVLLYRQPREGETATPNKYGFIEERWFGAFSDTKVVDDKTYYRNTNFNISFLRKEETASKYPVTVTTTTQEGTKETKEQLKSLTFSPTGTAEFSDTNAQISIGDNDFTCTVRRVLEEDEKYHMYILLQDFVIEIDVTYQGEDSGTRNVYEVTSMRTERVLYDVIYLQYLLNYMMQGYIVPNVFGTITLTTMFNEDGEAQDPTATGVFYDQLIEAGMTDSKGNAISFTNAPYEFNASNGTYNITIEGEDGVTYGLHFVSDSTYVRYLGLYGYGIYAFTRYENIEANDGFTVELERILFSEVSNIQLGRTWDVIIKKDGEAVSYTDAYNHGDLFLYFFNLTTIGQREDGTDDGTGGDEGGDAEPDPNANKIDPETAMLYIVEFTPDLTGGVESDPLAPYLGATVTEHKLNIAYDAEGECFVAYFEGCIALLFDGTNVFVIGEDRCVYENGTYNVTTVNGRTFSVTVSGEGVATITETTQTDENANA